MVGRRILLGGHGLLAAAALEALAFAGHSISHAPEPVPQSPENAEARRSAAEEKRRRKNARRASLSPSSNPIPHGKRDGGGL